jgi:hypothetical protein
MNDPEFGSELRRRASPKFAAEQLCCPTLVGGRSHGANYRRTQSLGTLASRNQTGVTSVQPTKRYAEIAK